MSICFDSPPLPLIHDDPRSPPPTPRKRAFHSKKSMVEVPLFFPCSQSVFGSGPSEEVSNKATGEEDAMQLFHLLSSPPTLTLKPKPRFATKMMHEPSSFPKAPARTRQEPVKSLREVAHLLPPPPFVSPSAKPSFTTSTSAPPPSTPKQSKNKSVSPSKSGTARVQKLPPIQRTGMKRNVDRRNSMVARCA